MARKKKPTSDKRDAVVWVRVSPSEKETLEAAAVSCGLPVSQFVRLAAIKAAKSEIRGKRDRV